ncbi:hypothetical protein Esti_005416 [Eimeria stiedai]
MVSKGAAGAGAPPPLLVYVSQAELREFAAAWPSMFPNFQPASVDPLGDPRAAWRRNATSDFVAALKKAPSLVIKEAQVTTTPLRVKLVDEQDVICFSHAAANLISLHSVTRKSGQYYGQLLIHHEDGSLAQATNLELPLNALNPHLFSDDSHVDERTFRGTAVCHSSGTQLQILGGWPTQPDAQLVQEATGSTRRSFFGRLFRRDAASSKKGPLEVLLCLYPVLQSHGEEVNPVTVSQSLHKSREQAYSLLATLMVRRALSEAAQQLSARSEAAAALAGPTHVVAYAERSINNVLSELEWVGLSTGLRLRTDGSPVLPRRFSLNRLYGELASRVHSLVDDTTNAEANPWIPLKVQKLRYTIASLEKQCSQLRDKAGGLSSGKHQTLFDVVSLKRWLAVYEVLLEKPTQAPTAQEEEQLSAEQEAFLAQVRAEEAAHLQRLMERRVLLEAAELEALIAGAPSDEVKEDRLMSLEPWIQQLEEVVRVARLADVIQAPALNLILHYGEKGRH